MKQYMSDREFSLLKDLMAREFGLSLKTYTKEDLAKKLSPRLQMLGLKSFDQYHDYLISGPDSKAEFNALPASIMNSESYFLREFTQYRFFIELLRSIVEGRKKSSDKTVRILSAGCAYGQEPYSLSMLLRNYERELKGWKIIITALDINPEAIEKAKSGLFHAYSFRNSNSDFIKKYFKKTGSDNFRLDPHIIGSVDFRQGNILRQEVYRGLSSLDFIFCRNLLIYMNLTAENRIARNFWEALSGSGYLFLGQTESFRRQGRLFEPIRFPDVTAYKKKALA